MHRALFSLLLVLLLSIGGCAWFKANEATIGSAIQPVESCLINAIASGELAEPMLIVVGCTGATIELLYDVVAKLIVPAFQHDAGVPSDAGVATARLVLTPYQVRLLHLRAESAKIINAKRKAMHKDASVEQ